MLTAWRRAVWRGRFGNPTIRFIIDDWILSMNFCCSGLNVNIFRLYKRYGNPMVFHKCSLTSVARPVYEQLTEANTYMARRDAFTRLSIWASHDMLDVNVVSRFPKFDCLILCPPRFQNGYLMKGFLLDIIQFVLISPKLKHHFLLDMTISKCNMFRFYWPFPERCLDSTVHHPLKLIKGGAVIAHYICIEICYNLGFWELFYVSGGLLFYSRINWFFLN